MEQSRLGSLIESLVNIMVGYWVAILSQVLVFPMFGIVASFSTNLQIGAWFTMISLIRSYLLRRWFNARLRCAGRSVPTRTIAGDLAAR